jgi:O-succinylhomoserine sulfhydrylase
MDETFDPATIAVRGGTLRTEFQEHSEAMFLTSSFIFKNAAEAAARFSGAEPGNVYARFTNPSVAMFESRLAALEGAERCVAFSSGMASIMATVIGLMNAGEHVVASRSIFGSTVQLFNNILSRFGIETTFVSPTDPDAWRRAAKPNTRLFFLESPSNPLTEVSDIRTIAGIAHECGAWLAVDNCFCTPILQRPLEFGADIVIHSATKYLDGQGRVLGGAVLGEKTLMEGVYTVLRTAGPTLSAFNAWVLLKGLETLPLRMAAHSRNALELATWLEQHPKVERVLHPALPSHPQHALAMAQQKAGGGIVSFDVVGGKDAAWKVIDHTRLVSITANLGDTRTTITHPATTTHSRMTPEQRADAGIGDSLVRIAVGVESVEDLKADLERGLALI